MRACHRWLSISRTWSPRRCRACSVPPMPGSHSSAVAIPSDRPPRQRLGSTCPPAFQWSARRGSGTVTTSWRDRTWGSWWSPSTKRNIIELLGRSWGCSTIRRRRRCAANSPSGSCPSPGSVGPGTQRSTTGSWRAPARSPSWHHDVDEYQISDAGAGPRPPDGGRAIELIAFVPYPPDTTPSQRFRIEQWRGVLDELGIRVRLAPFADLRLMSLLYQPGRAAQKIAGVIAGFVRQARNVATAGRADAILIHRAACLAGPALLEHVLTLWRKPILFDFDDAIYLRHTSGANRLFDWLKFPGKTAALCRLSSFVVAGNEYLAAYARKHNPRVVVVPTSIDTDLYTPTEREDWSGRVTIGWTGSATSLTYLETFAPVLRELLRRRDVEIRVQSNRPPALSGVPVVWQPWSPETEIQEIRRYHIGIKPMP